MRVLLICSADVGNRRIKIRRKKNKQDAWLPQDIEVRGVMFLMMQDAINQLEPTCNSEATPGVLCKYPVDLEASDVEPDHHSEFSASQRGDFEADESSSDEADSSDSELLPKRRRLDSPPAWSEPTTAAQRGRQRAEDILVEMRIRGLVARQGMELRTHKDDQRSHADIAFDYAQLVLLRDHYVRRNFLDWEEPWPEHDQKGIWNEDLQWWFRSCRPKNCKRGKQKLHSIFRVWLRECFGETQAIRDILRNSCCWATWRELQSRQSADLW